MGFSRKTVASDRWRGATAAPLVAMVLLAGCVTGSGYPGSGSYPGNGSYPDDSGYPGGYGSQRLQGSVQYVDLQNGRIVLGVDARSYGDGWQTEVYFDRNTQLVYQGRAQDVQGLERGDRIGVDAVQSNGRLWARRIELLQNVRDGAGGGANGGQFDGAVSYVDPRARVITITRGGYGGSREQVHYDARTRVEYRGQLFRPEQLDPGDVIRVQARPWGNGWLAERIWVEANARSR